MDVFYSSSVAFLYVSVHLIRNLATAFLFGLAFLIFRSIYRISQYHPLSKVPGPLIPRVSSLWLVYHAWIGDECTVVHALHEKYGSVVRTGPNSVDIADGEALHDIYVKGSGFRKPMFYGNFDIDGHKSIFSETVPERRSVRAKAVIGLFSTGSLRARSDVLQQIVDKFVHRLQRERGRCKATKGERFDLLDLTRGLALDVVTGYLFGKAFGGLDSVDDGTGSEERGMAANGMVDLFVGVGRFWYLPAKAFEWVEYLDSRFGKGSAGDVSKSLDVVDKYVATIVEDARIMLEKARQSSDETDEAVSQSYPARLLNAGLSMSETKAQCKDLIFAGTDSTGMNLATILFHLSRNQETLTAIDKELEQNKDIKDLSEIQGLPYLRGVIREGLRLSMANPSRLPRVVPRDGWKFEGLQFPSGTEVSCTPFELHLNADVFTDPEEFRPDRWQDSDEKLKLMERDSLAFGLGSRQCIARNLATIELFMAVKAVVESKVLVGSRPVKDKIEVLEWFNSHVIGERIEVCWDEA